MGRQDAGVIIAKGMQVPAGVPELNQGVAHPGKLLRIAAMVREVLEDIRHRPLDERGRTRLWEIHERVRHQLEGLLSEGLRQELEALTPPLEPAPSESEILLAQAQLIGWLGGLIHEMEAALWTQHLVTQAHLEGKRREGLKAEAAPGEAGSAKRWM